MKYKAYEKLTDFFRLRLFSKTNIAIIAVLSIVLNVAMAGLAYSEHRNAVLLSSQYASELSDNITDFSAIKTTSTEMSTSGSAAEELLSQTEPSTEQTEEMTEESEEASAEKVTEEENQQGGYYVTDSGTKYHIATCGYLSKSRHAISLTDAKARGYTPCSRCIK